MDDLDRKILTLLAKNARMPVKEIAEQVSLTSPAVSSRIHKLETDGIISGYTVTLNRPADRMYVDALISLSVAPSKQDAFLELLQNSREVLQCYHVTGAYTFLVKVSCGSMAQLEHLILQFQKLGTTSTQIILSTPVTPEVTGASSSSASTRSALANTCVSPAPRFASATTGPKELRAVRVHTSTPCAASSPRWYSHRLTPSTASVVNKIRVLVTATISPSRYFSAVCFAPSVSLWAVMPAARAAVS